MLLCLILAGVGASRSALAAERDGSKSSDGKSKSERELTIVPFVGGSSDQGFGGGLVASLARVDGEREPFVWRIEAVTATTVLRSNQGDWSLPYNDDYLLIRFPHLIRNRLGLELRLSFTREARLTYYGLGNAAEVPEGAEPRADRFHYVRVHPTALMTWRYRFDPWVLSLGGAYTHNSLHVPSDSRLAEDMQSADPYLRSLLGSDRSHGVPEVSLGVGWDTRDDEIAPTRGFHITQEVDVTPGTLGNASYRFARLSTAARFYASLLPQRRRLVLAARVVLDLLAGDPPFYALARYGHTSAIGGSKGVRGVPAQRYYGKAKVFSNWELRSEVWRFRLLGDDRRLGLVAFCDFGRLWADYQHNPTLDGMGWGIKYGLGGGLRLASGDSFVLRADVAWSPDAYPVSGYLVSGHAF